MLNHDPLYHLYARRQVSLRRLAAPGPDEGALLRILDAAAQAPDHGKLRPWRFVLVPSARRADLGQAFVDALLAHAPAADAQALQAARDKALHAPCLLVAVLVDDPAASEVPREEKLVSLGCAVQNMLVAAQALRIGSGLASGASLQATAVRGLLGLGPHEQAISFIGFGSAGPAKPARQRPDPGEFFSTI